MTARHQFKNPDAPQWRKRKTRIGSGVIAGGRYVPTFKPLQRDPFEHKKLCERAR